MIDHTTVRRRIRGYGCEVPLPRLRDRDDAAVMYSNTFGAHGTNRFDDDDVLVRENCAQIEFESVARNVADNRRIPCTQRCSKIG